MGVDVLLDCFGERVPLTPLIAALQDEDVRVRESSLDVLANHPEYAPFDLVARALDDQQPSVRCAALLVLERMGSERVPQEEIAERIGVSVVPLREALRVLEGEGQVTYWPRRGYFVTELHTADLVEISEVVARA